jgi:hypothetical protein
MITTVAGSTHGAALPRSSMHIRETRCKARRRRKLVDAQRHRRAPPLRRSVWLARELIDPRPAVRDSCCATDPRVGRGKPMLSSRDAKIRAMQ